MREDLADSIIDSTMKEDDYRARKKPSSAIGCF
jgi:hypothetical protein